MHPITNSPKTPLIPMSWSKKGNEEVTTKMLIQKVREQIEMHIPRTLVGKISEHKMLGIAPNPMTKQLSYIITLTAVTIAFRVALMLNKSRSISTMRDTIRIGIVYNSIDLSSENIRCHCHNLLHFNTMEPIHCHFL